MHRGSPQRPWAAAVLLASASVGALLLSLALFDHDGLDWLSALLFWAAPLGMVVAGGVGRWRGVAVAFALPAAFVVLFPEGGEPAPVDPGSCDPFCADPVAGLHWAFGSGLMAALLAGLGWAFAGVVRRYRPRLVRH